MKPNVVALAADARMFPAAAFLAARLAAINPRPHDTEIVVFSDSLASLAAARTCGIAANFQHIDGFHGFHAKGDQRISGMAFLRLFLADLLPDDVRRLVYLDADTYPENRDLFGLFDIDMAGHAVAAVRDVYMVYGNTPGALIEGQRVGGFPKYLQSGVLLIDRAAYLAAGIRDRCLAAVKKSGLHDQAALNVVLKGDWQELSPAMNMLTNVWHSFVSAHFAPSVLHFWGAVKPWHRGFAEAHNVRSQMTVFFQRSPWPTFVESARPAVSAPAARSGLPASAPPPVTLPASADVEAIRRYLSDTAFADVQAGVTRPLVPVGS